MDYHTQAAAIKHGFEILFTLSEVFLHYILFCNIFNWYSKRLCNSYGRSSDRLSLAAFSLLCRVIFNIGYSCNLVGDFEKNNIRRIK